MRLQKKIVELLLAKHSELDTDDVTCTISGESGVDIKLSPAARKVIPLSIECKNQEKLNIWGALEQSETNCKDNTYPAVVFKRNRSDIYITMKFEDFLKLT